VITTDVPAGAVAGEKPSTLSNVNCCGDIAVAPSLVTVTGPETSPESGTVAVIVESSTTVNVALVPLNFTAPAGRLLKPDPVIVTVSPRPAVLAVTLVTERVT
jgi:hypothetical protein